MRTEQETETSVLGKFGSVLGKICPGLVRTAMVGGVCGGGGGGGGGSGGREKGRHNFSILADVGLIPFLLTIFPNKFL